MTILFILFLVISLFLANIAWKDYLLRKFEEDPDKKKYQIRLEEVEKFEKTKYVNVYVKVGFRWIRVKTNFPIFLEDGRDELEEVRKSICSDL